MQQLTGNEKFTIYGDNASFSIIDFWRWAYSDLINNTQRGILAEFLVFSPLYNSYEDQIRTNWDPFDGRSPSERKIKVKSAAYVQNWTPKDRYASIRFDIGKKLAWNHKTASYSSKPKRNCDLYVFLFM